MKHKTLKVIVVKSIVKKIIFTSANTFEFKQNTRRSLIRTKSKIKIQNYNGFSGVY